ncbi:hypothetical protein [Bernardetia sp.]|uniref:hypothetical protein n=1 Tax=Bernardetia sp. TaxID=1937974 RepID=UPI0025B7AD77|nr:hypothetical protein [Bernardetia sp.]
MKALFLYFLLLSFSVIQSSNLSTKDNKTTTCESLQKIVSYLKETIPSNENLPNTFHFSLDCEKGKVYGFNIHDMLDTTNYIQYRKGRFNIVPNHLYHVYAWEYALSTSNLIYIEENGKITFFEAVNCTNRGNSLEDVEKFIKSTITDEDKKQELLKVLPSYREFGYYLQGCGLATIWECEQN